MKPTNRNPISLAVASTLYGFPVRKGTQAKPVQRHTDKTKYSRKGKARVRQNYVYKNSRNP